MAKSYYFKINEPSASLWERARQLAEAQGYTLQGNDEKGLLLGPGLRAAYRLRDNTLVLIIHDKPAWLSWDDLAQRMTQLLQSPARS